MEDMDLQPDDAGGFPDASAVADYFAPLDRWLTDRNKGEKMRVVIDARARIPPPTFANNMTTTAASFAKRTSRQNNLQLTGIFRKEKGMRLLRRRFLYLAACAAVLPAVSQFTWAVWSK
jgi:hypothetical protein